MSLSHILELNEELRQRVRVNLMLDERIDMNEVLDYLEEIYEMLRLTDRLISMRSILEEEAPTIVKVKLLLAGLSEDLADYLGRESRKTI